MSSLSRLELAAPDPEDVVVHLPPDTRSPAAARAVVESLLTTVAEETRNVAKVLVSELVANAVRHAGTEAVLAISVRPGSVVVSVADGSSQWPRQQDLPHDAEAGRGLQLVDALAASWGWTPAGPGKRVWFELRTAP